MLDPPGISESERSDWTPPHTYIIIKKPELAFASPFHRMRLKAVVPSSYDLNSQGGGGGVVNNNTAIVSGPGSPDLISMCRSCAIPGISVRILSVIFCLQTVRAKVWPNRSKLSETLTVF